ncbi:MAG TPA: diaminopimelate decarboxylase [Methanocorpusculum sp.]|nr:diaminopimelate decarboxylase [Methanocorpusculum sp.]HJJ40181.1 diaminopimelate decarboxylase [Methanocorpusculum sp.]HJJ49570.1 diaminopimelate decarboxylase [Methanocorpusculum sp.]HJJ57655.1 diaminopimelate decarboxylase [Methanocorpusculum sp.]
MSLSLPTSLTIKNGHLHCGGKDCVELIEQFGSPLYVTDEIHIIENYRRYEAALKKYTDNVQLLYAAKANENPVILQTLAKEGAGSDLFSLGEMRTALEAGMPAEKLLYNGSSKTEDDLKAAITNNIRISVDSIDELRQIDKISKELKKQVKIGFRVNPEIEVPTHPKIATGIKNSKFGIPADMILDAYKEALSMEYVIPVGMHCHIGSQILEVEPFAIACGVIMKVASEITKLGVKLEFVDFGGGLGIPYHRGEEKDAAPTPEEYAAAVMPVFVNACKENNINPAFWVEPGRWMVGESTILLTKVNSVKKVHKTFVNVDAGFNILIRPAMYDSWHEVMVANKADESDAGIYTVTGPICETGDILAADRKLPKVTAGDIIAVLDAGAYGYAMSSQYNSRPRCAEVLVNNGKAELMRRAETYEDMIASVIKPSWH